MSVRAATVDADPGPDKRLAEAFRQPEYPGPLPPLDRSGSSAPLFSAAVLVEQPNRGTRLPMRCFRCGHLGDTDGRSGESPYENRLSPRRARARVLARRSNRVGLTLSRSTPRSGPQP